MAQHILVLGATGPSGIDFCNAALREGHKLTLYARNPSKLPADLSSNPLISVIQGQLDDRDGLQHAASCGAKICVSFIGPIIPSWTANPITAGYKMLIPLLIEHHFERGLFLSTPSYTAPGDTWSIKWYLAVSMIWLLFPTAYRDIVDYSTFIASQPINELRWTLFRLPNLRSGPPGPARAAFKGDGNDGWNLERKALAEWVLLEMKQEKWVGQAPIIFNA